MLEKFWQIRCTVQYVTEEAIAKGQKVSSQREGNGRKCIHISIAMQQRHQLNFLTVWIQFFPFSGYQPMRKQIF